MATREENLKKINEELELLDDEQLDSVAGGVSSHKPAENHKAKTSEGRPEIKKQILVV